MLKRIRPTKTRCNAFVPDLTFCCWMEKADAQELYKQLQQQRKFYGAIKNNAAVLFRNVEDTEKFAIYSENTKSDGKFRITFYDEKGAINHIARDNKKELFIEFYGIEDYRIAEIMR